NFLNQTGQVREQGQVVVAPLSSPWFYVTGLPISEAYWARATIAGQVKDVMIQAFERRVLTYTPTNTPAFQVEMGNIGQHYYDWRYNNAGQCGGPPPPTPPPPPPGPAAPTQVSPPDGTVFRIFPRVATFTWNPVSYPGGVTYGIE